MKNTYFIRCGIRIAIADVGEVLEGVWIITRINVPEAHRGKGIGSSLLRKILVDADEEKVTLVLEPLATGRNGLNQAQLEEWYRRHGFEWSNRLHAMERMPH